MLDYHVVTIILFAVIIALAVTVIVLACKHADSKKHKCMKECEQNDENPEAKPKEIETVNPEVKEETKEEQNAEPEVKDVKEMDPEEFNKYHEAWLKWCYRATPEQIEEICKKNEKEDFRDFVREISAEINAMKQEEYVNDIVAKATKIVIETMKADEQKKKEEENARIQRALCAGFCPEQK